MCKCKILRNMTVFFLCLLLTSCGANSGKWLVLGVDLKTELGIRSDSVETFAGCIRQQKTVAASELKKLFQKEAAVFEKNKVSGDWGKMVCLAFNKSATVWEVRTTLSLLPKEKLSSREEVIISLLRPLLDQRARSLSRLVLLQKRLNSNLETIDMLKEQVEKLQAIEGLLEKNE